MAFLGIASGVGCFKVDWDIKGREKESDNHAENQKNFALTYAPKRIVCYQIIIDNSIWYM